MPDERTTDADTPNKEQVKPEDSNQEGETVPTEQYKSLQSDYTRKTQELSRKSKELAELKRKKNSDDEELTEEESDQEKQLEKRMEKKGFVRREDLQDIKEKTLNETEFNDLLRYYPELRSNEKAIRDLADSTGKSYEDVALEYGFTSSDKLAKAKSSRSKMLGSGSPQDSSKPKSLRDASLEEYEQWKKDQDIGSSSKFIRK